MNRVSRWFSVNHIARQWAHCRLSYCYLFFHYDPLWSSSCDFGGDYPRSGPAL